MGKKEWKNVHHHGGGAVYGLGFIGAVIYYFQQATKLWEGVLGFVKALAWPGILIYKLLEFLKL